MSWFRHLLRRTIMTTAEQQPALAVPVTATLMDATAVKRAVAIPPRGVDYRDKVVLAPMVRSGELPMRLVSLHYGADLVWGPETVDRSLIGSTLRTNPRTGMLEWTRPPSSNGHASSGESVIYRLDPVREAGRLIFQLGTSDPARAVAAARMVAPHVAGIDVNAGCPKPFSTSGGMGAALLRVPDTLAGILKALVHEIVPEFGVGISVKIRLLETPDETERLVCRLVGTGITGLTIHCRTTPMRPRERAIRGQLGMIARVCREAGVACVMNGDVESREHAQALIQEFGVDGAMIATAAEKNPSCFRLGQEGGLAKWDEVAEKYVWFAMDAENKFGNTKFSLNQLIPGRARVFKEIMLCKSYEGLVRALGMDQKALTRAKEVDRILGIGAFKIEAEKKNKGNKGKKTENNGVRVENKGMNSNETEGKKRKREDETACEVMKKSVQVPVEDIPDEARPTDPAMAVS